jgi:hypothetical protein
MGGKDITLGVPRAWHVSITNSCARTLTGRPKFGFLLVRELDLDCQFSGHARRIPFHRTADRIEIAAAAAAPFQAEQSVAALA